METKQKLSDLIINTLNDEFNLDLKTVDSFAMSERIQQLIDENLIITIRQKLEYWREAGHISMATELDILNGIEKLFNTDKTNQPLTQT